MARSAIGTELRARRTGLGLSLADVATRVGATRNAVWYVERHGASGRSKLLHRLARALDIPLARLTRAAQIDVARVLSENRQAA